MGAGRTSRRIQALVVTVPVLAAMIGGGYALARAFGGHAHAPRRSEVGGVVAPQHHTARPSTVAPKPSLPTAQGSTPLCSDDTAAVSIDSQEGAAGTIQTVWKVTNTSGSACRSHGYPGMDFHTNSGWLEVQVNRGGYVNIQQAPTSIVVQPGDSLYFVSYWGDATTTAGNCKDFDRVKVTQPDNTVSAEVAATGCFQPDSVYVGPVTSSPPS
jgi:uncharacterized protein DUF4232